MEYYEEYINEIPEGTIILKYENQENIINNRAIYNDEVYVFSSVKASFSQSEKHVYENRVIGIHKRNEELIVGVLHLDSVTKYGVNSSNVPYYLFKPVNKKYNSFYVSSSKREREKMYVVIRFTKWDTNNRLPYGNIIDYLGKVGEESVEYEMLRYYHNLYLPQWKLKRDEIQIDINEDIDYTIFSIDPLGSKDIDDAFHFNLLEDGSYELGIHIASPTHYFRDINEYLNILQTRISTVYLPHKNYPLLPRDYADNIISLLENQRRYALSLIIHFKTDGGYEYQIRESKVINRNNYNYDEIDRMIHKKFKGFNKEVKDLYHFTRTYYNIDKLDSHKLVELWMIFANRIVAEHLVRSGKDKIILRRCLTEGVNMEILNQYERYKMRREWKSAEYVYYNNEDTNNYKHKILNLDYYTHFTSPIRRSVDFYTHLMLRDRMMDNMEIDLNKINDFTKRCRKLDRDIRRMQIVFNNQSGMIDTKGIIVEKYEKYILVYIPEYDLEEKIITESNRGYIIEDMERMNIGEEKDIRIWIFKMEENVKNKLRIEFVNMNKIKNEDIYKIEDGECRVSTTNES